MLSSIRCVTRAGAAQPSGTSLLCRVRTSTGLTQEELAERAGLSVRSISDIERGLVARPRRHSIAAIADGLGLDDRDRERFIDHYRRRVTPAPLGSTTEDGIAGVTIEPAGIAQLGVVPVGVVPAQLPAGVATFTGREQLLHHLDGLLADRSAAPKAMPIAALDGMGGVGKTALAVHWSHRVRSEFPDGQLSVDLRGYGPEAPLHPARALQLLLLGIGIPAHEIPDGTEARSALFRSRLDGRRMLAVLDNARNSDQVRPLLPGGAGCMVIVTSRSQLRGLVVREGAHRSTVEPVTAGEGLTLLRRFAGAHRVAAEPSAAAAIAAGCAGLPLALRIVADLAARQPDRPLAGLARELRDAPARLDLLDTRDGDPAASVRGVFAWSYDALPEPTAAFFRRLARHQGPDFDLAVARRITGVDPGDARAHLDLLVRDHLVEALPGDRFRLHDLLRAYALDRVAANQAAPDQGAAADGKLDQPPRRATRYRRLLHKADAALRKARTLPLHPTALTAPTAPTSPGPHR